MYSTTRWRHFILRMMLLTWKVMIVNGSILEQRKACTLLKWALPLMQGSKILMIQASPLHNGLNSSGLSEIMWKDRSCVCFNDVLIPASIVKLISAVWRGHAGTTGSHGGSSGLTDSSTSQSLTRKRTTLVQSSWTVAEAGSASSVSWSCWVHR